MLATNYSASQRTLGSGRSQGHISTKQQGRSGSSRSVLKEMWTRHFNGPHYLDAGPANRHILSLRSTIPSEVDWALHRLIQVSGTDPDLLRLPEFPGLLDGLFGLVREFLEHYNVEDLASYLFANEQQESRRRRATEAAMILRNLATEKNNKESLLKFKKLAGAISDVLEIGLGEEPDESNTFEMRAYLLEVLEVVGDAIPLVLPGRSLSKEAGSEPEPLTSPSVRLFPLLVRLTRSPDRNFVISSFRCLTAFASNESSEAALALVTYPADAPHPHPIHTAIELLPLADAEISIAILDYIYQHTLVPANAALFCARPDLIHILRLVCSKLHLGANKEILEVVLPIPGADGARHVASQPKRHKIVAEGGEPSPRINGNELDQFLVMKEPQRTLAWMQFVFESHLLGEITQVALWTAYKTQFDTFVSPDNPLLPAADVIKMSTDAFPDALPMVTDGVDRKFIIKGIRVRDRPNPKTLYACYWAGCAAPLGPTSPESLYWHLHHHHISLPEPPMSCLWLNCSYSSRYFLDPSLRTNDISLHARTHMPVYHPPAGYGDADTPPPFNEGDFVVKMRHERYHAHVDEQNEVTGQGLLSCLVIRNVARTVRIALGNPAGGASVQLLSGGEESIFEAMAAAAEGGTKTDPITTMLEKVDYTDAKRGADALRGLEETLVSTTVEDFGLGKILGEALEVVTMCRKMAGKVQVK